MAKKISWIALLLLLSGQSATAGARFDWLMNCLPKWLSVSGKKAGGERPAEPVPAKPRPAWQRLQLFPGKIHYEFLPTVAIPKGELDADLAQLLGPEYGAIFLRADFKDPHSAVEKVLDRYASDPPEALYVVQKLSRSNEPNERAVGALLEKIIELQDAQDPRAILYFEKLGHNRAIKRGKLEASPSNPAFDWPEPPHGVEGEYWDMASGLLSVDRSAKFTGSRRYRLFDASPYVSRQMATLAQINGLNLAVENKDIRYLAKPEKPIAVLRVKNAATYARGFEQNVLSMADWIAPKGHLLLQEDTLPIQLARTVHRFGLAIQELMKRGWTFEFHGYMQPYYCYTIRLVRPEQEHQVELAEVERQWNGFLKSVPILEKGNLEQYETDGSD